MCLLNKAPEYIILFLLILLKNIFGIYGSSGPPPNRLLLANAYHREVETTSSLAVTMTSITTDVSAYVAASSMSSTIAPNVVKENDWVDILFIILKASIMISIIVAAVFGNLLVIISVMRNRKLR